MKHKERYAVVRGRFCTDLNMLNRSLEARSVYVSSWAFCAEGLTDGIVPKSIVCSWWGPNDPPFAEHSANVLRELLVCMPGERRALWEDRGDHYYVLAYTDHNKTKKQLEDKREKAAKRMRKNRNAST